MAGSPAPSDSSCGAWLRTVEASDGEASEAGPASPVDPPLLSMLEDDVLRTATPPPPGVVRHAAERRVPPAERRRAAIGAAKARRQLKAVARHVASALADCPPAAALAADQRLLGMLLDGAAALSADGDPEELFALPRPAVLELVYSLCAGTPEEDRSQEMDDFLASIDPATARPRVRRTGPRPATPAAEDDGAPVLAQIHGRTGRARAPHSEAADQMVPEDGDAGSALDSEEGDDFERLGDSTDLSDLQPTSAESSPARRPPSPGYFGELGPGPSERWLDDDDPPIRRPITQRRIQRGGDGSVVAQGRRVVQAGPSSVSEPPSRLGGPSSPQDGPGDAIAPRFFVSPGHSSRGEPAARPAPSHAPAASTAFDSDAAFDRYRGVLDDLAAGDRRRRRPRYRNPRQSSPYHLVPEEPPRAAQEDGEAASNPDGRTCRICLGDENWASMLAPCACDGSAKWVHRVCLARWRKTATNVISKVQCEVCHSYYRLSRSSGRRYGLEAHLTLGGATVVCEIFLVLYYMLLTYVVGFATRVAANLLPANLLILPELPDSLPTPTATPTGGSLTEGMFDDQILQSSATVLLLAVKFLFAVFQLVNRLRMTWNHLPLSFFMLGAYNRLTDRAIFTSGAAMCLASFATGVLWPARILGDVLWCFSVAWAFPLLWQDTKRRARMIAPRLLLLLVEVGDRGEEEVLNHDD